MNIALISKGYGLHFQPYILSNGHTKNNIYEINADHLLYYLPIIGTINAFMNLIYHTYCLTDSNNQYHEYHFAEFTRAFAVLTAGRTALAIADVSMTVFRAL